MDCEENRNETTAKRIDVPECIIPQRRNHTTNLLANEIKMGKNADRWDRSKPGAYVNDHLSTQLGIFLRYETRKIQTGEHTKKPHPPIIPPARGISRFLHSSEESRKRRRIFPLPRLPKRLSGDHAFGTFVVSR